MPKPTLREHIIRTLLYYEIFDHPLSEKELYFLLPEPMATRMGFREVLDGMVSDALLLRRDSLYARPEKEGYASIRLERERIARRRLKIARVMTGIIKRFPFVRAVLISGDLSKGVATQKSDIDFVIVTEPRRLWICRSLLIAFKKVFLLNSRKYFCLNYFVDSAHLTLSERDYYTATEIAHLQPMYNFPLYLRYMNANAWIREYFPNYRSIAFHADPGRNRRSILQAVLEWPLRGPRIDRLDASLMEFMRTTWKRRYPEHDEKTRDRIFRCTPEESRAYGGNFSERILSLYRQKLEERHD